MGYDSPWKGKEEQFLTEPTYPLKPPHPLMPTPSSDPSSWQLECEFCRDCPAPVPWMGVRAYVFGVWTDRHRGRGSLPWGMLFVSYWRCSLLVGLDWLTGWHCNQLSHWNLWNWIQSCSSTFLSTLMPLDGLSETEYTEVKKFEVLSFAGPLLLFVFLVLLRQ